MRFPYWMLQLPVGMLPILLCKGCARMAEPCFPWRSGVAPQHLPFSAEFSAPVAAENTAPAVPRLNEDRDARGVPVRAVATHIIVPHGIKSILI